MQAERQPAYRTSGTAVYLGSASRPTAVYLGSATRPTAVYLGSPEDPDYVLS